MIFSTTDADAETSRRAELRAAVQEKRTELQKLKRSYTELDRRARRAHAEGNTSALRAAFGEAEELTASIEAMEADLGEAEQKLEAFVLDQEAPQALEDLEDADARVRDALQKLGVAVDDLAGAARQVLGDLNKARSRVETLVGNVSHERQSALRSPLKAVGRDASDAAVRGLLVLRALDVLDAGNALAGDAPWSTNLLMKAGEGHLDL